MVKKKNSGSNSEKPKNDEKKDQESIEEPETDELIGNDGQINWKKIGRLKPGNLTDDLRNKLQEYINYKKHPISITVRITVKEFLGIHEYALNYREKKSDVVRCLINRALAQADYGGYHEWYNRVMFVYNEVVNIYESGFQANRPILCDLAKKVESACKFEVNRTLLYFAISMLKYPPPIDGEFLKFDLKMLMTATEAIMQLYDHVILASAISGHACADKETAINPHAEISDITLLSEQPHIVTDGCHQEHQKHPLIVSIRRYDCLKKSIVRYIETGGYETYCKQNKNKGRPSQIHLTDMFTYQPNLEDIQNKLDDRDVTVGPQRLWIIWQIIKTIELITQTVCSLRVKVEELIDKEHEDLPEDWKNWNLLKMRSKIWFNIDWIK